MTSYLGWLDYSEHERKKMLDVIQVLGGDRDTRDELGIGTVRDALADLLFPGISTIQTRARYFLFVPWMYLDLERRRISSSEMAARARREETRLIETLAMAEDQAGVIGIEARANLKRLPSNVYWQGLGIWGIRLFEGGQDAYHLSLDNYYRRSATRDLTTSEQAADRDPVSRSWHPALPPAPEEFPAQADFSLSLSEADYLRDRVLQRVPGTLLAFLVDRAQPWTGTDFPWMHPQLAEFPAHNREQLRHAELFALIMFGASLLYNLMLADLAERAELQEDYASEFEAWSIRIRENMTELRDWNLSRFWNVVDSNRDRVPFPTRRFVEDWIGLVLNAANPGALARSQNARDLIRYREIRLKRAQARLENRNALSQWGGAAGAFELNYRWGKAQSIILDILQGLSKGAAHA